MTHLDFSSVDSHYLAGLLDRCLTINFKSGPKIKVTATIHGYRSLVSFLQGILGGTVTANKGFRLNLSMGTLFGIAQHLRNIPCLLQPVYASLLRLREIKASFSNGGKDDLATHRQIQLEEVSQLRVAYKAYQTGMPQIEREHVTAYKAGYIEGTKWLAINLQRGDSLTVSFRPGAIPTLPKTAELFGRDFSTFVSPFLPHMRFRRAVFEEAIKVEAERSGSSNGEALYDRFVLFEETCESAAPLGYARTATQIEQSVSFSRSNKRLAREKTKQAAKDARTAERSALKAKSVAESAARAQSRRQAIEVREAEAKRLVEEKASAREARKVEEATLVANGQSRCRKCEETLPLDKFGKNRVNHTGYSPYCKACCFKEHYLPHREIRIEKTKAWIKAHPQETRVSRKRDKSKPHNRLRGSIKRRLDSYLKTPDKTSYRDVISCSPKDLAAHLESQFAPSMSWANYGTHWHIDHIIPCAAFDWSKPEHLKWCWHHKNLRPLNAAANIEKRDFLSTGDSASDLKVSNLPRLCEVVGSELERLAITTQAEFTHSWESQTKVVYLSL